MNNTPQHRENLGLWLGLLGVFIFALTLPMTRLATGTVDAPQMSPWFVTWARAALAGGLSAIYLLAVRDPWPLAEQRGPLFLSLAGNVIGYPLLLGWALRHVTASHAAVITSLMPLATAAAATPRARPPSPLGTLRGGEQTRMHCEGSEGVRVGALADGASGVGFAQRPRKGSTYSM